MPRTPVFVLVATAVLAAGSSVPALAQVAGRTIDALEGVGIEQKLGAELPRDARCTTSEGVSVTLGELFDGTMPVLLTLNYTECPMLCSVHLTKLVEALGAFSSRLVPGEGYRIVTVCIDPADTAEKAARMKAEYVGRLASAMVAKVPEGQRAAALATAEADAAAGWTFLVADEPTIHSIADAVGFGFKWVPAREEFAHPDANIVCTPDARVARYFGGIDLIPGVLRMSLVEASEGKVGSLFDGIFLSCFIYDPHLGSYALAARRVMSAAGALMVLGILTGFFFLRRSEARATSGVRAAEETVR
jgi:protein SCO1/2